MARACLVFGFWLLDALLRAGICRLLFAFWMNEIPTILRFFLADFSSSALIRTGANTSHCTECEMKPMMVEVFGLQGL